MKPCLYRGVLYRRIISRWFKMDIIPLTFCNEQYYYCYIPCPHEQDYCTNNTRRSWPFGFLTTYNWLWIKIHVAIQVCFSIHTLSSLWWICARLTVGNSLTRVRLLWDWAARISTVTSTRVRYQRRRGRSRRFLLRLLLRGYIGLEIRTGHRISLLLYRMCAIPRCKINPVILYRSAGGNSKGKINPPWFFIFQFGASKVKPWSLLLALRMLL